MQGVECGAQGKGWTEKRLKYWGPDGRIEDEIKGGIR